MSDWTPPKEQAHTYRVGFMLNNIGYYSEVMSLNKAENEKFEIEKLAGCGWITEAFPPNTSNYE